MGAYKKDINYIVTKADAQAMIDRARNPRDKALFALLYLTGARESELIELREKDIIASIEEKLVYIRLTTKKLGRVKGFVIGDRTLEIPRDAPFMDAVINWASIKPGLLFEINESRVRQLVYEYSDNRFCPMNFRHSRLTKLSRAGASVDELMYFKGAADLKSVGSYIRAKPIGRELVIE